MRRWRMDSRRVNLFYLGYRNSPGNFREQKNDDKEAKEHRNYKDLDSPEEVIPIQNQQNRKNNDRKRRNLISYDDL